MATDEPAQKILVKKTSTDKTDKPRRAKGEGSLFERADGKWIHITDLGRDAKTGKRKRQTIIADTKAKVLVKLADERKRGKGTIVVRAPGTVGDLVESWLDNDVTVSNTKNTAANYRTLWVKYGRAPMGSVALDKLAPAHVQRLYRGLLDDGVSASVIQRLATAMHRALQSAIESEQYHRANPFAIVQRPAHRPKEARSLDAGEAQAFLSAAEGDRFEALWHLLLAGGLRLGEALALRWQDVDFKNKRVVVNRSYSEVSGGIEIKNPKNQGSRRSVDLDDDTLDMLRRRQEKGKAEEHGSELCFPTLTGTPMRRSNLRRSHFQPILAKAKLGHLRIHDLRHATASLLIQAGISPTVIASRLGHSTTRMLMDRYAHILTGQNRQAAESIARAIRPRPAPENET